MEGQPGEETRNQDTKEGTVIQTKKNPWRTICGRAIKEETREYEERIREMEQERHRRNQESRIRHAPTYLILNNEEEEAHGESWQDQGSLERGRSSASRSACGRNGPPSPEGARHPMTTRSRGLGPLVPITPGHPQSQAPAPWTLPSSLLTPSWFNPDLDRSSGPHTSQSKPRRPRPGEPEDFKAPLLIDAEGRAAYTPWGQRDMATLAFHLPPLPVLVEFWHQKHLRPSLSRPLMETSSGYGNAEDKALMAYRHKRITASNFGLVLAALKRNSYPPSLFKTLLGQYNLKQGSHACDWGILHEPKAKQEYMERTGVTIQEGECSFLTVACSVALQMGRWLMTSSLR
ncbi:unnamed protein product [Gadus morhua 'NCC']